MMTVDSFAPLALFAVVATVTPGGATALATASGAQFGFRRSVPLMAGIAFGLASLAAIAAVGLAGLLLAAPTLQLAMKLIGSTYLIWLALKIGRSGRQDPKANMTSPTRFLGGVGLLWLNPKGWAMALGAAASFAGLANGPLQLAVMLGVTFGVAAAMSLAIWCSAGLLFARMLRTDLQWRALNVLLGLLLAASVVPIWLK
jgi:threonine/homoserine/homoserine lactone efflux protein